MALGILPDSVSLSSRVLTRTEKIPQRATPNTTSAHRAPPGTDPMPSEARAGGHTHTNKMARYVSYEPKMERMGKQGLAGACALWLGRCGEQS